MLIGVTGQIGGGKTEVAKIFKKYGAFVISADKIGKDVIEKNPIMLDKLVRAFGESILTKSGRLRRKKLGEIAFSSEADKKKLNKIIHPELLKELGKQVRSAEKKNKIVVIDAALLIDWQWHKIVDITILVHASHKTKIDRLKEKGYSEKEARMRLKSQLKYRELRRHVDIILLNDESLDCLEVKVRKIIEKLN